MESFSCNAETFLQFLQYLTAENKDKHLVIVLDNALIHHAKLIQPFLKQHEDQLTLLFLPPYSPNLNMLERIWKWLKGKCHCQPVSCFTKRNTGFCPLIYGVSGHFSRQGAAKNGRSSDVERLNGIYILYIRETGVLEGEGL
ncbi:transposase [Domibacillus mangrovi]|uniref:transposase n=1 Tax=Domibacillus mangrovi TaxID=1714354 RepID=UPI000B05C3F4|nr:transposase [Domibacillus mangrovi]